jgi:phenylacetate-coenzyme A ligase PaaK-like adenylate-forming protein
VVREWGGFEAAPARLAALSARVSACLRGHLGLNPEIAVVAPKTIPRSEGKAVRVGERRTS